MRQLKVNFHDQNKNFQTRESEIQNLIFALKK